MHAGHDPATPFDSYHFESVSFESIYRLLSPYKAPIGLALYFEPSVGDQETELEWKILLQKNWLEDRLVWALNINYELEFEKEEEAEWERDGVFEWFTGISYRFIRNWSAGLEFWNHHEFADATVHEHSAYFLARQFITEASVGGPASVFFINCQSARLSARTTRSSPRTTATFLVTNTRNITCG